MKIVLLRHAESLGNVDELAYCRIPDHALPLTPLGEDQSRAVGPILRNLFGHRPTAIYVSPYLRAKETLRLADLGDLAERIVEEPRLREQDWGNLQDPVEQKIEEQRRHEFGHFFHRLNHGESGADVDDRVASFLAELESRMAQSGHPGTALIVSHGLAMRLLCRRLFSWSIDLFESLSNPSHCEYRALHQDKNGTWKLDRPFEQWRESPDGTTQN